MSAPVLSSIISLLISLAIAIHALAGWLRVRDRPWLLMALVFSGSVAAAVVNLTALGVYQNGGAPELLLKLSSALSLISIYLFFLFMAEFTPVPQWLNYLALGSLLLLVGWIAIAPHGYVDTPNGPQVVGPDGLRPAEAVYVFAMLILLAVRFWQHSVRLVGLIRKRVQAIALGTTLAIVSIIPALLAVGQSGDVAEAAGWLSRLLGLVASVIYYLAFATPRWLRDIWTSSERRRIGDLSLATAGGRLPGPLIEDILKTAIDVSGARAGALALVDERSQDLRLVANKDLPADLADQLLNSAHRFSNPPVRGRTAPIISSLPGTAARQTALLDTPMFLAGSFVGVIRLLSDRSLVFEREDAAIMEVLGAQSAVSLDTALRLDEMREEARRAGQLYSEAGISLRQRVSELRAVLGSMADGLYVVDPAGRILLINRVAAELAGFSEVEAIGRPASEIFKFALDHAALTAPALERGEVVAHQESVLHSSDEEIPVSIAASPLLDEEGQPRGVVVNFRDISVEKEVQRVKDEFIATVSHELRTPLTAILGYADLLLRGTPDPATARQKTQLQAIRNNGSRLLTLINDLLDLSKIEAGQVTLNLKPVSVANVVDRAIGGLQVLINNKKQRIETSLPLDLPLVLGDPDRLNQIMDNLLSNAIKFTPNGGQISVKAHAVGGEAPAIVVDVTDTGIGIEPEHIARIWDRFYQVESSATRRFGGTGLGLPIVKHLVEMHGGELSVSSPGKDRGSTFSFTLPVVYGVAVPEAPALSMLERHSPLPLPIDNTPPDLSKPLVLVADDDPYFVHILRTRLESEGYRIAEAGDGAEAMRMARELRPFAITLDIQLPRADGWSVLNQLKRDPLTQHIPVVVMSVVDNREFGLTLGATDYLVKPIDYSRLVQTLHRLTSDGGPGAAVLVVEDDDDVRNMLHQALEEGPWHTLAARDGREALAAMAQTKPGVVILDLMMPNMDGFEMLAQMRANPETAKIPVIILTAKELTEDEVVFLNSTAQRLIPKQGQKIDQLVEEVRRTLSAWRDSTVRS